MTRKVIYDDSGVPWRKESVIPMVDSGRLQPFRSLAMFYEQQRVLIGSIKHYSASKRGGDVVLDSDKTLAARIEAVSKLRNTIAGYSIECGLDAEGNFAMRVRQGEEYISYREFVRLEEERAEG